MQTIEAIVFDFDGVIVNTEPLYEIAEKRLFADYGIIVPDKDWKIFKGSSEADFYHLIKERYNITASETELRRKGRQFLLEVFSGGIDYLPGYEEFLKKIDGTVKTGLVTATSGKILAWIFQATSIRNSFKYIVTAEDVKRSKPHPEPYHKMFDMLNVVPSKTIVIEDSINGIRSAKAAGAITIGLCSSFSARDLDLADYAAKDYSEIENIVFSILKKGINRK
jgi:HAD superfamily hydrolase (TIGR01509 family)